MHSNYNLLKEDIVSLLECATEGIVISSPVGVIMHANSSAHRIFGYETNTMGGCMLEDLIPDRHHNKHKEHRITYNAAPKHRAMGENQTLVAKRKDGSEFPVEISLSYILRNSEPYVLSFIADVTEKKRYQEALKKLNQELENKVKERTHSLQKSLIELQNSKRELTEMLGKEMELSSMKSRFVTMASHEFRTPLAAISTSISLIEKYHELGDHEKHHKHVYRIKSAIANMALILEDFLSTESLNKDLVKVCMTEFSLKDLVNEVIIEMQSLLDEGQELVYNYEGGDVISLDREMIKNILVNLISNAIKFSAKDGKIMVDVKVTDRKVWIQIRDEGIGIPKEDRHNLYQRFYRAKNVTNIEGTGLGLYIVAKYVELMKGKIEFNSELNMGTTFIVEIPITLK